MHVRLSLSPRIFRDLSPNFNITFLSELGVGGFIAREPRMIPAPARLARSSVDPDAQRVAPEEAKGGTADEDQSGIEYDVEGGARDEAA